MSVTEGGDGKIQLSLIVSLPEELFAYFLAPFLADVPWATWIGNVGTLESDLKDEVTIFCLAQVE